MLSNAAYTDTVSKCKENDHKFVIKLAEKVIKPLMQRFLEEKEGTILTAQEEEKPAFSDEDKIFKCEVCEKVCISLAGLQTVQHGFCRNPAWDAVIESNHVINHCRWVNMLDK